MTTTMTNENLHGCIASFLFVCCTLWQLHSSLVMMNVELMMVVGVVRMRATMYSLKALVSLSTTFNSSSMAAWSGGMTFLKNKSSIKM